MADDETLPVNPAEPPSEPMPPLALADSAVMPALIASSRRLRLRYVMLYDVIGGDRAAAEWAQKNRTEYYRLLPRMMPKEVEHTQAGTLEDYLDKLDAAKQAGTVIDGEVLSSTPSVSPERS